MKQKNKIEQIMQGLEFAKHTTNCINVVGIENCKKLTTIYNNLDVFLNMLASGEVELIEKIEITQSDND